MRIKKWNEIFGYSFIAVGALKMILICLAFMSLGKNVLLIFGGGQESGYFNYYITFLTIIAYCQIILAIASIVMIILNMKVNREMPIGYLWGPGALVVEAILPSLILFIFIFAECGMYVKAGTQIRKETNGTEMPNLTSKSRKEIKQAVKDTEWFFGKDDK